MRSLPLLWAIIFIFSIGCGGVVKENRDEKAEEQPVASENEYGIGEKEYPNPFSPFSARAGVDFTLEKPDSVKIELFTFEGEKVGVVTDSFFNEGYHYIGLDNFDLKSGVYCYRITTSDGVFTKKMTLLR